MKRRTALEYISLGLGYTVASPGLLSLIQSCQSPKAEQENSEFQAAFLAADQVAMIDEMADILLPQTDTPGAKELNVGRFVDGMLANTYKAKDQATFKAGIELFVEQLEAEQNAKPGNATREQLSAMMQKLADETNAAKTEEIRGLLSKDLKEVSEESKKEYQYYSFVYGFRGLAITAYFQSELIGEKHLNYSPVPGPFEGCIPLEEGQKDWSLG